MEDKKKRGEKNRRFCTTTNNLTNSRKGKMLGLFFLLLVCLPRYRKKKKTPKTCRSPSPLPRATSPLLNCSSSSVGRHALSRWSVVCFYSFFIFIFCCC